MGKYDKVPDQQKISSDLIFSPRVITRLKEIYAQELFLKSSRQKNYTERAE